MKQVLVIVLTIALISCSKNQPSTTTNNKIEDPLVNIEKDLISFIDSNAQLNAIPKQKDSLRGNYYFSIGDEFYELADYRNALNSYLLAEKYKYDKMHLALYNISCMYSLLHDTKSSITYLELALNSGYTFFDQISSDDDLINTRRTEEYIVIMEKHTYTKSFKSSSDESFINKKYLLSGIPISHINGIDFSKLQKIDNDQFDNIANKYKVSFPDELLDYCFIRLTYNGLNKIVQLELINDYRASTGVLTSIISFDAEGYCNVIKQKGYSKMDTRVNRNGDVLHIYDSYFSAGAPDAEGEFHSYFLLSKNGEVLEVASSGYEKITQTDGKFYFILNDGKR